MKTIGTISTVVFAMAAGSAILDLATGLPLAFALLEAVALVALSFAATIVVGAVVHPYRAPIQLRIARATRGNAFMTGRRVRAAA